MTYTDAEIDQAISRWAINLNPFKPTNRSNVTSKEVALALKEIRNGKLYRGTHNNFYLYCAERWGLRPDKVNRYLSITEDTNFSPMGEKSQEEEKKLYIYFLRSNDLIKIGFTTDIPRRIASIQAMSPVKVELIKYIKGDKKLERKIHMKFSNLQDHGEWFKVTDSLLKFIEDL